MTTTTDVNSMIFHSSTRMNEELSNSLMDIDDPSMPHQNGIHDDKDNVFHQG